MGTSPRYSPLINSLFDSSRNSPVTSSMNTVENDNIKGTELFLLEEQQAPDCLVLLQIASYGCQGTDLGTDESPVAMLTAKIFDIHTQTVSFF